MQSPYMQCCRHDSDIDEGEHTTEILDTPNSNGARKHVISEQEDEYDSSNDLSDISRQNLSSDNRSPEICRTNVNSENSLLHISNLNIGSGQNSPKIFRNNSSKTDLNGLLGLSYLDSSTSDRDSLPILRNEEFLAAHDDQSANLDKACDPSKYCAHHAEIMDKLDKIIANREIFDHKMKISFRFF
ncbi:uncharacterized protein LOC100679872 isoform X2 [Nasonia vitripennis]|uniref:Uncharacterized protein n=1 Tax=Nasonia vitripennis TaxID=7425 RepID=A0A7M7PYX2_NASVI|nr:uncharacterized protein LOC100679872 isoform X2 [Nasonia vitripennis]